jgi:hypothetical protein
VPHSALGLLLQSTYAAISCSSAASATTSTDSATAAADPVVGANAVKCVVTHAVAVGRANTIQNAGRTQEIILSYQRFFFWENVSAMLGGLRDELTYQGIFISLFLFLLSVSVFALLNLGNSSSSAAGRRATRGASRGSLQIKLG